MERLVNHMSTTTRTARRLITLSASVALIATAPGLVGVASATDNPAPSATASHVQVTLSPELVKAIQIARDAYKTTTRSAKDTYKVAKKAMHTAIEASLATQHDALKVAHDALKAAHDAGTDTPEQRAAYEVLKAAYETAKDTAKVEWLKTNADPKIALNTAIEAARATYTAAVKAAFATYAPTATIPAGLLEAPGKGHGKAFDHLTMTPAKGTMHVTVKPHKAHTNANSSRI
jgi:hypothetical protein